MTEVSDEQAELRDLTPEPGRALDEQHFELTPDGRIAVTGWAVWDDTGSRRTDLVAIDCATGERSTLLSAPGFDFYDPHISPDGTSVLCTRETHQTYEAPADVTLLIVPLPGRGPAGAATQAGSTGTDGAAAAGRSSPEVLLAGLDRWPVSAAWAAEDRCVYFTADDHGRCPIFRTDRDTGAITKITTDDAAYSSLIPSPDGRFLYALRAAVDSPPAAVRIDLATPGAAAAAAGRAGRAAGTPRPADRDRDGGRRRGDPWLARAAGRCVGRRARASPAVGPRRPAGQLEFMVVAVEPVADGGPRLRGAAARPGAVHRVRPRLHRPRSRRSGAAGRIPT